MELREVSLELLHKLIVTNFRCKTQSALTEISNTLEFAVYAKNTYDAELTDLTLKTFFSLRVENAYEEMMDFITDVALEILNERGEK